MATHATGAKSATRGLPGMSANTLPVDTDALIAHILERCHETHRRELPGLIAQAMAVSAPLAKLLADLREHMRVEDELLFPRFRPAAG